MWDTAQRSTHHRHSQCTRWGRITVYGLPCLILMIAFGLRVHRLADVPFGWHPDEASKALLARDVLAGKYAPAFFSAFTGRDALYVYLEAVSFALIGEGVFAGRILSAFIGILTVAATVGLGKLMVSRRTGLLAGLLLASSLWHVIASRNGYRAVIQPLIQIPVLALFFRAWRRQLRANPAYWASAVVGGAFLGLTQYTYTAARAFPLLAGALVALAAIAWPSWLHKNWRWVAVAFVSAIVVLVPVLLYFAHHPFDLYGRAMQVSFAAPEWSGGDALGRLRRSVVETLRMFSIWGDPNYRFNIAGRPVFGPLLAIAFYLGLAVCLWRAAARRDEHWLHYAALLVWLIVMLLPMTLSAESLPYFQRAIGIIPAVYLVPAAAIDTAIAWASERAAGLRILPKRAGAALSCILMAALAVPLTWTAAVSYFREWHGVPRNDDDRRVAMVYVASDLVQEAVGGALYISSEYIQHPTLAFLAPPVYDRTQWFDARQSLPLPPAQERATYVMLRENPPQTALIGLVPDLRPVRTARDRFDRPVFHVYEWAGGEYPVPEHRSPAIVSPEVKYEPRDPDGLRLAVDVPASFGDVLVFRGHDRAPDYVHPGDLMEIVVHWDLLQKPDRHYSMFVHLLDDQGHVVAEHDANRFPTSFWRVGGGEKLLSYFPLSIDATIAPGSYRMEVGVYHQPTGERLPVVDDGQSVGDRLLLAPVTIE